MYATHEEYRAAWDAAYKNDPPIPLNLDIELASTCNAKCTFCLYGDRDWSQGMKEKDWDGKTKKRFMPTDMALRLIDEAAEIGIPALKMNFRGESTLHKDYSSIMLRARLAEPSFKEVLVNTNGDCPNQSIFGLMQATKVMVSLDSMNPETYKKVRVGLNLQNAINTIDVLVLRGHKNIWVRRVVCNSNREEDFVGAVRDRWPQGVKVSEHYAFDRSHYAKEEIGGEDHTKWERQFCGYPSQRIVVEASGRYSACCIAWEGELSGGTYPKMSLMEYWNSPWRTQLASGLRKNKMDNAKCKACTSFMAFKRPEREKVQDVEAMR